jgi:hypothetical protein
MKRRLGAAVRETPDARTEHACHAGSRNGGIVLISDDSYSPELKAGERSLLRLFALIFIATVIGKQPPLASYYPIKKARPCVFAFCNNADRQTRRDTQRTTS